MDQSLEHHKGYLLLSFLLFEFVTGSIITRLNTSFTTEKCVVRERTFHFSKVSNNFELDKHLSLKGHIEDHKRWCDIFFRDIYSKILIFEY